MRRMKSCQVWLVDWEMQGSGKKPLTAEGAERTTELAEEVRRDSGELCSSKMALFIGWLLPSSL